MWRLWAPHAIRQLKQVRAPPPTARNKNEKTFHCDQGDCDSKFTTELHLNFHRVQHKGLHRLKCDICSKEIPTFELSTHLKAHGTGGGSGEEILSCPCCSHWSSTFEKQTTHLRLYHHRQARWKCEICGVLFQKRESLDEHHRDAHIDGGEFKCDVEGCFKVFARRVALIGHKKFHSGRFSCEQCGKKLYNKKGLESHYQLVHGAPRDKRFSCDQCPEAFVYKPSLTAHMIREHGADKFKCVKCSKEFTSRGSLHNHSIREHDEGTRIRAIRCPICDERFVNRSELRDHVEGHTGRRDYICEECGKTFPAYSKYQRHKLTHNARKFKCPDCPWAFTMNRYLRQHKRVHTGEKPYVCDMCGQAFTQQGTLNKHRYKSHAVPAPSENNSGQ